MQEVEIVEIQSYNLLFGVVALELHGDNPLYRFLQRTLHGALGGFGIELLGKLLGDGAAALGKAAGAQVGHQCPGNGHRVHTLVVGEAGILRRDHGVDVGLGQLGIGNEPLA